MRVSKSTATQCSQSPIQSKTTWDALIESYCKNPRFKRPGVRTQEDYRSHCETIREKNGPKNMTGFRRKHAIASRDALQDTWSKRPQRARGRNKNET